MTNIIDETLNKEPILSRQMGKLVDIQMAVLSIKYVHDFSSENLSLLTGVPYNRLSLLFNGDFPTINENIKYIKFIKLYK